MLKREIEELIGEVEFKICYLNQCPMLRYEKNKRFQQYIKSVEEIKNKYVQNSNFAEIIAQLKEIDKDLNVIIVQNNIDLLCAEITLD